VTPSTNRSDALARALHAGIERDWRTIRELCVDDVRTWTPALSASSTTELLALLSRRDDAFSEVDLEVVPLEVAGDFACVEWTAAMTHSGPLTVGGGDVVEPTGIRVILNGVTVAEFRGDRICALRQYWDELSVFEQLGLLAPEAT